MESVPGTSLGCETKLMERVGNVYVLEYGETGCFFQGVYDVWNKVVRYLYMLVNLYVISTEANLWWRSFGWNYEW
jgi:hypothetical protein